MFTCNFYEHLFYKTPSAAASGLNYFLIFLHLYMKYLGVLSTKRICSLLFNPYLGGLFRNSFWGGGGSGGGGRGGVVQLPNCFKLAVNRKNGNGVTISRHDIIVKFFWRFVPLIKFSYWSMFHVNVITGSGVTAISFYKGLTRNRKYPHLSFAQYLKTGSVSKEYQIWHERL